MPGQRDRHTGCVGAYLVEHDLFDFMLFSLPDNDTYSHKAGPDGQVRSIAEADRALERIMHAAGGVDEFLEKHAVIVMSDHSQTEVDARINLADALRRLAGAHARSDPAPTEAELAVCPAARSAHGLRARGGASRRARAARGGGRSKELEGVDLVVRRRGRRGRRRQLRPRRLRFAPGDELDRCARRALVRSMASSTRSASTPRTAA